MTKYVASTTAAVVRQNAPSAAIAAVLMLYFGFASLAEPTGTGLFERSNWIFYHTVRIGGVAMALIAVGSWLGHRIVLAADAVVSTATGILFIISSGGMLISGGGALQNGLLILFGMMFISAGIRNGRLFASMTPRPTAEHDRQRVPADARNPDPAGTPTARPQRPPATPDPPPDTRPDVGPKTERPSKEATTTPPRPTDQPDEPAGGFLAGFARKPPPNE